MKHVYDENQILFSRIRLKKGTKAYEDFYRKNPAYQQGDDAIRGDDFEEGMKKSASFQALFNPIYQSSMPLLKSMHDTVEAMPVNKKRASMPKHFHENIKEITKLYGATDVGIVQLKDEHYYAKHGLTSASLGKDHVNVPIKKQYKTAIVYMIPMDKDYINRSPHYEEMLETMTAYQDIAVIGAGLAMYLKGIGFKSMFQSIEYYETPLVPLAYDAGLGEIGMSNHIIHPIYGDRIRLGAVLTTLELKADQPIDFGLESFCKRCGLCVMNCPMQSIKPQKRIVNGRTFYKFDDQSCYKMWKNVGNDCGVCIQSCPYAQGIDLKTQAWMRNQPDRIDQFLKEYLEKTGPSRRYQIKTPLPIVKEHEDDERNND